MSDLKTIKDLFTELKDEATYLLDFGNSKEAAYGRGIEYVIKSIEEYYKENKIILNK